MSNLPMDAMPQQVAGPVIQAETSQALNYSNVVHFAGKVNDKFIKQSPIENVGALAAGTSETTATFRFAGDIYNLGKSYLSFELACAAPAALRRYFFRNDQPPISWIKINCDQLEQKIDNFSHVYKMLNSPLTSVSDFSSHDSASFDLTGFSKSEFFDPFDLPAVKSSTITTLETEAKAAPFLSAMHLNIKRRSTSSTLNQIGSFVPDPLVLHYTYSGIATAHTLRCTIPFKNILDSVFAVNKYIKFPNNIEITVGFHGLSNIGEYQSDTNEAELATCQPDFATHVVNTLAITVSNLRCVLCRAQDPSTRAEAEKMWQMGMSLPCPYIQSIKSTASNAAAGVGSDSRVISRSLADRLLRVYTSIFMTADTGITHAKNSNYNGAMWSGLKVSLGNQEFDYTEADLHDVHRQFKAFYDGSVSGNYASWVVNPVLLHNLSGEDYSYEIPKNMHKVAGMPIDGSVDHVLTYTNVSADAKNIVRVLVGQRTLYSGPGGMKLV